ncbi:MAG TPA: hypothetical protein V6D15_01120 [Oculatellaceae cyanobacterium]|jgi:hypothetical protein
MTASLDLKEVAALVIDEVKRLIAATSGAVILLNDIKGKFEIIAEFGGLEYGKLPLEIGKGIIGDIILTGKG